MDEITLFGVVLGGLLTSIGLYSAIVRLNKLDNRHVELYKDFHELNLFVRGVLSLPEEKRPRPTKKLVDDDFGDSKTRRAINEAVNRASSEWKGPSLVRAKNGKGVFTTEERIESGCKTRDGFKAGE